MAAVGLDLFLCGFQIGQKIEHRLRIGSLDKKSHGCQLDPVMTDEQKEDLQFWLYTKIFVDHAGTASALNFSAAEIGVEPSKAFAYLLADQRIEGTHESFSLRSFERDEADPRGVYVDIEWMLQILHRAGLRGSGLWNALGSIYKIPASLARQEAEQIPIVEGEG